MLFRVLSIFLCTWLILLQVESAPPNNSSIEETRNWPIYGNKIVGFQIKYPPLDGIKVMEPSIYRGRVYGGVRYSPVDDSEAFSFNIAWHEGATEPPSNWGLEKLPNEEILVGDQPVRVWSMINEDNKGRAWSIWIPVKGNESAEGAFWLCFTSSREQFEKNKILYFYPMLRTLILNP